MVFAILLIVALVIAAIAALIAVGRYRPAYDDDAPDRPDTGLPGDRPMTAADVDAVQFSVGIRGYRMDEVDECLARLRDALAEAEAKLAAREQADAALPAAPET